jgi:hypothetical protein
MLFQHCKQAIQALCMGYRKEDTLKQTLDPINKQQQPQQPSANICLECDKDGHSRFGLHSHSQWPSYTI